MKIRLNGEEREVQAGIHIPDLIAALGLEGRRVAVELNRDIVRKDGWSEIEIREADEIEIVQFVGGG